MADVSLGDHVLRLLGRVPPVPTAFADAATDKHPFIRRPRRQDPSAARSALRATTPNTHQPWLANSQPGYTPSSAMILEIFLGRIPYGPAMGNARHLRRIARRIQQQHPGRTRVVLSPEDGYSPSQLAVLAAIADQGERDMRELMNEPTAQLP